MIRERNPASLEDWLEKCEQSEVVDLQTFAEGLRREYGAIKAGFSLEWSKMLNADKDRLSVTGSLPSRVEPTLETIAAAWWLRQHVPDLKVRVVNVVDLTTLFPLQAHPHGMDEASFTNLFTHDKPAVFAFHGYQRDIHEIIHGRTQSGRFHVRGFREKGTTTTPFDMGVLNEMSRYHLCMEALRRVPRLRDQAPALIAECQDILNRHYSYVRLQMEDLPEVRDWVWS